MTLNEFWTRRSFAAAVGSATGAALLPATASSTQASQQLRLTAVGQALIDYDIRHPAYPEFAAVVRHLKQCDICFSNLETSILGAGMEPPKVRKPYMHFALPEVLDCLKELSVNVLALSNNHAFDLGAEGILATIAETRRRGITCAGTGSTLAEATAPAFRDTPAGKLALVAMASKVYPDSIATESRAGVNHLTVNDGRLDRNDETRNLEAIAKAAAGARHVLVYQHSHYWEKDRRQTPAWQKAWARACIDAGATIFVGHGVPLLHGIEIYKNKPIFYSLGNFIFHTDTPKGLYEEHVWQSVIADCRFQGTDLAEMTLTPIVLTAGEGDSGPDFIRTRGRPCLAPSEKAQEILARLQKLSAPLETKIEIREDRGCIQL